MDWCLSGMGCATVNKNRYAPTQKIPYDTVFGWSQSFGNLMKDPAGRQFFTEFLTTEYSDENMLFWQACEDLKKEINAEKIDMKIIRAGSPKQVPLDARVRESVSTIQRPTATMFQEEQCQIGVLMKRDSYPRFLNSTIYEKLLGAHGQLEDA